MLRESNESAHGAPNHVSVAQRFVLGFLLAWIFFIAAAAAAAARLRAAMLLLLLCAAACYMYAPCSLRFHKPRQATPSHTCHTADSPLSALAT